MYELLIQHDSTAYMPPVKEEVKVTTERQISPGVLEFSFVDTGINMEMVIRSVQGCRWKRSVLWIHFSHET